MMGVAVLGQVAQDPHQDDVGGKIGYRSHNEGSTFRTPESIGQVHYWKFCNGKSFAELITFHQNRIRFTLNECSGKISYGILCKVGCGKNQL